MKWIYILLIGTLLLCSSGIASAANTTGVVVIGGIVDMDKVMQHGGTFWDSANQNGGAGYLLLSIGFVVWLLIILFAIFGGSANYAIGSNSSNRDVDTTKKGTDTLKRVVIAIVAPPILLILFRIFVGLI